MKSTISRSNEEEQLAMSGRCVDDVPASESVSLGRRHNPKESGGLSLTISSNNGDRDRIGRMEDCGDTNLLCDESAALGDISATVVICSFSSLPFSIIAPNGLDRRKFGGMATYFNHLIDRLIRSGSDWMILDSAFEKTLYDSYNEVVELLVDKEIIEKKNKGKYRFRVEEPYCRAYRLKEKYRKGMPNLSISTVKTSSLIDIIEKREKKSEKPVRLSRLKYLKKLMLELTFDYKACKSELERRFGDKQTLLDDYSRLVVEGKDENAAKEYLEKVFNYYHSMGELISLFQFLRDFNGRIVKIAQSKNCQRLSSIYIQLASRWRRHLRWQGYELEEYDISCCHAPMWITTFAAGDEKELLKDAYEKGKFYDLFITEGVSRSFIKKQFQTWMNGDRYDVQRRPVAGAFKTTRTLKNFGSHPLDNIVAKVAPDFARAVRCAAVYGKKGRSKFACSNMQIEAAIMVEQMLDWASDTNTVYFPIHDGWMTVPGHGDPITAQVQKIWHREFGMTPHITKEGPP